MKRVTLKDIASALAVAPSTVSRALADHPDISPEMKTRVHEAAELMGYVPDLRARYLRARHSRLVALVVPEVNMFFVPSLMSGVDRVLRQNDYSLLVFESDDLVVQERKLARLCLSLSVDGVLLACSSETTDLAHLDALADADVPTVLLDKVLESDRHSAVSIDGRGAACRATDHLLARGHRRVLGVFGDDRQRISDRRAAGFRAAFSDRSLPPGPLVHVRHLPDFDALVGEAIDAYAPTALFVMSDELLVRAHHAVLARGLAIPADISLVAISDGKAPAFLTPTVTHLRHAGDEVGAKAAHILIGLLERQVAGSALDVKVRTDFVEGASVRVL